MPAAATTVSAAEATSATAEAARADESTTGDRCHSHFVFWRQDKLRLSGHPIDWGNQFDVQ